MHSVLVQPTKTLLLYTILVEVVPRERNLYLKRGQNFKKRNKGSLVVKRNKGSKCAL